MRTIFLLFVFVAQSALAADYFGAIAYAPKSGADGWAKDHRSREAAEKAAVAACRKHAKDCRPVVWFKNGCGSIAVSDKAYGWGWGTSQPLADIEALKACGKHAIGCKITRQVCTAGAR